MLGSCSGARKGGGLVWQGHAEELERAPFGLVDMQRSG